MQRHFPESGDVALPEKTLGCKFGFFRNVDLPFGEPLQQLFGGNVDEFYLVGEVEDRNPEPSRVFLSR